MRAHSLACLAAVLSATALAAQSAPAPSGPVDPRFLSGLAWRSVGPFRGGRISAVSGAIGQPGVFYAGTPAGGVWKTTSAGRTWVPVFDSVPAVSSIGAVDVAPSDPNVVYAGTGDMRTGGAINEGNGVYRSADAGRTWRHVGLEGTKQIPSLLVDPRDPNVVLVAAKGDVFARTAVRGVFRTTDGGARWTKTLYVDEVTGIEKLARAYDVPDVVFATTSYFYSPPGAARPPAPDTARTRTRLYRSADAGVTWREISGGGLPPLTGRTSIAVAKGTHAQRVYLIGNFGLYRSDDGGETWRHMAADDPRITNGQGGYNCGVYVDPQNPDVVYTFNTSSYRSTDGGNTFTGFRGAPGGDDPQQMWIDPTDGRRMIMGFDQGAIVSLDGGATWSSWYNQSTEQVYHVATDASFPYWIYATQQDAGAVATRSRGNLGAVTALDWKPVAGWEWGTVLPDPRDPDVVYSTGLGVTKITSPAETWVNIGPGQDPALQLRASLTAPLAWSEWNGTRELLAGYQYLMSTTDDGAHWTRLGPDLTVPHPPGAPPAAPDTATTYYAIESISPSRVAPGTIWVGTTNGLVQVTRDHGVTWSDVTAPGVEAGWRQVLVAVEASPFDAGTAYAVFDAHGRGDYAPHVVRTRDFGRTWTPIVSGLPASLPGGAFARVVRADPVRRGLLFAGTESSAYVSFDDGDHWQPLSRNLPTTSVRDFAIHQNDLVAGTYGRGLFVLDDYSVLRQLTPAVAAEPVHLFAPGAAARLRRNVSADTPFPADEPFAPNPPDGIIVYYSLGQQPAGEVTLDVLDAAGSVVRHLSSVAPAPVREAARPPEPGFWLAPPRGLSADAGLNRANWDLRYDPPPAFAHSFEINGNPGLTPASPEGPLALPGTYTLRLTVNGRRYTQPAVVLPDPRSRVPAADLAAQHAYLMRLYGALAATWGDFRPAADLRASLERIARADSASEVGVAAKALAAAVDSIAGDSISEPRFPWLSTPVEPSFVGLNGEFAALLLAEDNGDHAPTAAMLAVADATCAQLQGTIARWASVAGPRLSAFNALLARHRMPPIAAPTGTMRGCPPAG
jgi:photosystem II stability/assembly factor-like uncharacterized protein